MLATAWATSTSRLHAGQGHSRAGAVSKGPVDGAARAVSGLGPDETTDQFPGARPKTLMVGCCASSDKAIPETLRTVDFAARVRGIKNLPRVHVAEHQNLVQRLREEIARLKQENAELRIAARGEPRWRDGARRRSSSGRRDAPDLDFFARSSRGRIPVINVAQFIK